MQRIKARLALALLHATCALAFCALAARQAEPADTPRATPVRTATFAGRVLDPKGFPVQGARLLFVYGSNETSLKNLCAVSGADGCFRFTVPRSRLEAMRSEFPWEGTYIVAAADGYGFAVARTEDSGDHDLTLRLVRDDLPLRGRILNLEGQSVAGARVQLAGTVYVPTGGSLDPWLAAIRVEHLGRLPPDSEHLLSLSSPTFGQVFPGVTTGPDGRFQFRGIGRERALDLRIEGPTIATRIVRVVMRPAVGLRLPVERRDLIGPPELYYPASFDHVAVPTRPVIGVVRDRDTGKPLAGIAVKSNRIDDHLDLGLLETVTDGAGRFRLLGLPKGGRHQIAALVSDRPYLVGLRDVPDLPGLEPITIDFPLKRGTWVRGRVTDKATGQPVRGHVSYYCFINNPWSRIITGFACGDGCWTSKDGSYRVVALPGPGLIAVGAWNGHYRTAIGAGAIKGPRDGPCFETVPMTCQSLNYNALAAVSPRVGEESIRRDLTMNPGRLVSGVVLDPDGNPLAGARVAGLRDDHHWELDPLTEATFRVWVLPRDEGFPRRFQQRRLQFIHEGKRLTGSVVVSDDAKDTITVKLVPWGTVRGRIVGPNGLPWSRAELTLRSSGARHPGTDWSCHPTRILRADEDGTFCAERLVPGLFYEVSVLSNGSVAGYLFENFTIKPGEAVRLGDVPVSDRRIEGNRVRISGTTKAMAGK